MSWLTPIVRAATPMVRTTRPSRALADDEKSYYLSKDSLTFPGLAGSAGVILRFADSTPSKLLAFLIAVLLGGGLVLLGWQRTTAAERAKPGFKIEATLMGSVNIALMWIAIYGTSVIK